MLETVTLVSDIVANAVQRAVNLHRFHLLPALPPVRQGLRKWPVPEDSSESLHRTIPRRVQWGFSRSKTPKALPEHVSLYSFKIIVSHIQFSFLTVPANCDTLSARECLKVLFGTGRGFPLPLRLLGLTRFPRCYKCLVEGGVFSTVEVPHAAFTNDDEGHFKTSLLAVLLLRPAGRFLFTSLPCRDM